MVVSTKRYYLPQQQRPAKHQWEQHLQPHNSNTHTKLIILSCRHKSVSFTIEMRAHDPSALCVATMRHAPVNPSWLEAH